VQIVPGGADHRRARHRDRRRRRREEARSRGLPGSFQISGCNVRARNATIKATPDQIKAPTAWSRCRRRRRSYGVAGRGNRGRRRLGFSPSLTGPARVARAACVYHSKPLRSRVN
jgi:hypothetical protein